LLLSARGLANKYFQILKKMPADPGFKSTAVCFVDVFHLKISGTVIATRGLPCAILHTKFFMGKIPGAH